MHFFKKNNAGSYTYVACRYEHTAPNTNMKFLLL